LVAATVDPIGNIPAYNNGPRPETDGTPLPVVHAGRGRRLIAGFEVIIKNAAGGDGHQMSAPV
jgi:hypothetical protein